MFSATQYEAYDKVVDFEQLRRRTPPFNEGILESDNESRIRFAELRMKFETSRYPEGRGTPKSTAT
uniref:Homeobox domain-containing protein n=1 Tax=Ascaris lumbricoides TaxID=6252 RepID=A0A0M3HIU9_ASCLU